MLDRSKVMRALQEQTNALFYDHSPAYEYARALWRQICADATFMYKIQEATPDISIPTWHGSLGDIHTTSQAPFPHQVIGVDGSQVYPDRHHGLACYLINIGGVTLTYGAERKPVHLYSEPHLFVGETEYEGISVSPDLINCRRDIYELTTGARVCKQAHDEAMPQLLLLDGSLIVWHLDAKEQDFKQVFLPLYLHAFHTLYEQKTLFASYVSMPKHKEVSHLLRLAACNFVLEGCAELENLEHINDAVIMRLYLPAYARSTVFKHQGAISDNYPPHLKPHFFYLNVGTEIGRVEIPAWIASESVLLDRVASLIADQCRKGNGYPVVLAEAHEQAVVKGPDRDFLYHLIAKVGIDNKYRFVRSKKSMKKRGIGI